MEFVKLKTFTSSGELIKERIINPNFISEIENFQLFTYQKNKKPRMREGDFSKITFGVKDSTLIISGKAEELALKLTGKLWYLP